MKKVNREKEQAYLGIFVFILLSTLAIMVGMNKYPTMLNKAHATLRKINSEEGEQRQNTHQWQEELISASQQSDYDATFIVTGKSETHSITIDAKGCQKFDTRCIWQYTRSWIGIALDEINAQKANVASNAPSGLRCTLTYSVYQENPEKPLFQCQNDIATTIHYTLLKEFFKKKFR